LSTLDIKGKQEYEHAPLRVPLRDVPEAFELIMTISEREKAKPTCPTCKGTNVTPQFSGFMAQTGKKS
jgi:hypothetical protein